MWRKREAQKGMVISMKKIAAMILAGVMMVSLLAGCGTDGDSEKNTLTLGLDANFPPMGFSDENGDIVGFDIDLAKEVAKKMNVELKLQSINWETKEIELSSGKIDLIWNGLTMTPSREEEMTFTKPYLKNKQVVAVLKDSSIQTFADMKDKTVVLQKGSTAVDALNEDKNKSLADSLKSTTVLEQNIMCFTEVEAKRADAVIVDEVVAKYYLTKHPDKFRLLDETLADEFYGIAVKKGNTQLRDQIQTALDELEKEGIPFDRHMEQGIMIETPAAVIMSRELAQIVDFFSIGTNDLIQYTLAADRQNPKLGSIYNPYHPAVLRSIRYVVENAHRAGIWTSVSGELGADSAMAETFIKWGIDALAAPPSKILPLRKKICEMNETV